MKFMKGMDLSTLIEVERCGAKFYDRGAEEDVLAILKSYDVDTVRIRIWNDPYSENGEPYGAGGCDRATGLAIAGRATRAGMGVLLDFHYSDFWADPKKQYKPKAWAHMGLEELKEAVYSYTLDTVSEFLRQGVNLSMVQVGNEVTNGLLWPEGMVPNYDNIAELLNAGIRAVRQADAQHTGRNAAEAGADPSIRVMVHLDYGSDKELYRTWFGEFMKRCEPFDVIGLSYYPFWHGTIQMLKDNMDEVALRFGKDMIVVETSMGYTMEDYQEYEKLSPQERKGYATKQSLVERLEYPMTRQGQTAFIRRLMEAIAGVKDGRGKGFVWWEPAWIPVPGSGWATPASLEYIHEKGPCGNEWANQALFDYDGSALPALAAIRDFKR